MWAQAGRLGGVDEMLKNVYVCVCVCDIDRQTDTTHILFPKNRHIFTLKF